MLPYLVVTAIIAFAAIAFPLRRPHLMPWAMAYVMLLLFVGLRHKVGMDWNNYLIMTRAVEDGSLWDAMEVAEPAFALLLWTSTKAGFGIYGANLVGTAIFCAGLFRYARATPLPLLALTVSMPILVVVVAMSANRQAVAIGILLWLAARWQQTSLGKRVALTILAAMFHFSAIFFLMFSALGLRMRAEYKLVLGVLMSAAMFAFLHYSGGAEYYDELYISGQTQLTQSSGASQHVLLNGLPAALVLIRGPLRERLFPTALHRQMAWLAMALVPASFVFSVAAGRMTLYLFPVSMYALAALPGAFGRDSLRALVRTLIAVAMCGVLAFWLNFANSRRAHLPYNNALLIDSSRLQL